MQQPPPYDSVGQNSVMRSSARWAKPSPIITSSLQYTPPPSPADVPTAVSTLLGLTKQLQEVLRLWSVHQATESQVSDAYILVGLQFNATVNAFARHNVDMSDLFSIPTELRTVLETCLGEEQSPRTLDKYMPEIRMVLYNLLQGLQSKQAPYRKSMEAHHRGAEAARWTMSPVMEEFRRRSGGRSG
ncbi:hypothetical protein QCA50_008896 [Cerrena zonata]|uniref:Aip3p/Bud6 N-terminal domain-containing protein n=1 Tax=Cerrena zonata TaxID=2478898 RepID=A0AAW0G948_9APHY